ncbi:TIGR00341 family protein [Paenimyroides tangerinum]|uniref:TIGR00341 family protein n=2 Tax=Flavobacteriales TaxID=200644 RepID=A0A3P3W1A2_9FLAO|nr:TIGR00341 family protein [Paenimyroides tangerinum]
MKIFNPWNLHEGEENKEKVLVDITNNISFNGANLWILACAILIASIGLNMNSTAVIIGAMLISPLMGPIVGAGFALATFNFQLLSKSLKNLLIATCVSLIVSTIYFYLSPFKEVQSELLARTSPTIYDVMIAFFGGIVGAISITRKEKGNPISGVAIATALMPPLCTAGFGLATGDFKFFVGAVYLYAINCFFIGISTYLIIKYLKYKPQEITTNLKTAKNVRYGITILLFLITIPSLYIAYQLLQEKKYNQNVNVFLDKEFVEKGHTIIYKKINFKSNPKKVEIALISKKFDSLELNRLNDLLKIYTIPNSELIIKQNTQDLKQEILAELKKNNNISKGDDIQIKNLRQAIAKYQLYDQDFITDISIVFPEIKNYSVGLQNHIISKDSIVEKPMFMYESTKNLDTTKLKKWLINKWDTDEIDIQEFDTKK